MTRQNKAEQLAPIPPMHQIITDVRAAYAGMSEKSIRIQARWMLEVGDDWPLEILRELVVRKILAYAAKRTRELN